MALNEKEITEILEKIRTEYKANSKLHPKAFDLLGFEQRYLQTIQLKANVTRFLNDEVAFLEQLKTKYQELIAKKEAAKGETINRIMDEAIARLEEYEKIDFHPLAKPEIRYFYGALKSFGEEELPALIHIFRGTPEFSQFQDSIHSIERIAIQRGHQPPPRIIEHIKSLLDANGNPMLLEKDAQDILKSTCLSLKKIANLSHESIEKNRISPDIAMKIDEREYPKATELNKLTHKDALQKIADKCKKIIDDFRMTSLVS